MTDPTEAIYTYPDGRRLTAVDQELHNAIAETLDELEDLHDTATSVGLDTLANKAQQAIETLAAHQHDLTGKAQPRD